MDVEGFGWTGLVDGGGARTRGPSGGGIGLWGELKICGPGGEGGLGFEGVALEFGVELGAELVEVGEGEGVFETVAGGGCGDEWLGGEGEEGGAGAFGEGAEAIP